MIEKKFIFFLVDYLGKNEDNWTAIPSWNSCTSSTEWGSVALVKHKKRSICKEITAHSSAWPPRFFLSKEGVWGKSCPSEAHIVQGPVRREELVRPLLESRYAEQPLPSSPSPRPRSYPPPLRMSYAETHRAPPPDEASRLREAGGKGGSPTAGTPLHRTAGQGGARRDARGKPFGRHPRPVLTVQVLLLGPHDLVGRGLADGFRDRRAGHAVLRRRDAVGEALAGHGGLLVALEPRPAPLPPQGPGRERLAGGWSCTDSSPRRAAGGPRSALGDGPVTRAGTPPPPTPLPQPPSPPPARLPLGRGQGTHTGRRRKMAAAGLLLGSFRAARITWSPAPRPRDTHRPSSPARPAQSSSVQQGGGGGCHLGPRARPCAGVAGWSRCGASVGAGAGDSSIPSAPRASGGREGEESRHSTPKPDDACGGVVSLLLGQAAVGGWERWWAPVWLQQGGLKRCVKSRGASAVSPAWRKFLYFSAWKVLWKILQCHLRQWKCKGKICSRAMRSLELCGCCGHASPRLFLFESSPKISQMYIMASIKNWWFSGLSWSASRCLATQLMLLGALGLSGSILG